MFKMNGIFNQSSLIRLNIRKFDQVSLTEVKCKYLRIFFKQPSLMKSDFKYQNVLAAKCDETKCKYSKIQSAKIKIN